VANQMLREEEDIVRALGQRETEGGQPHSHSQHKFVASPRLRRRADQKGEEEETSVHPFRSKTDTSLHSVSVRRRRHGRIDHGGPGGRWRSQRARGERSFLTFPHTTRRRIHPASTNEGEGVESFAW